MAAVLVMLSHLHGVEARYSETSPILSSAWLFGVSGVDLFFVISGFVMVWVAGDLPAGRVSAAEFFLARLLRIYPVWWLFAGAMSLYFFLTYGVPWDADALAPHQLSGNEHLLKSFLLLPHDAFPVLQLGWTLIHEVYFYFVFGLILLLPKHFRLQAFLLWGVFIVASMSAGLTGAYANSLLSLALFPMTLEFLMGVAVGLLVKRGARNYAIPCLCIGLIWLCAGAWSIDFSHASDSLPAQRTLAFGPAFAFILYALVSLEQKSALRAAIPAALVRLGDWSYSLYLCHLLIISAVARLYFPTFGEPGILDNIGFLVISSVIAILAAAVTNALFERPILSQTRKLRKRLFPK